ncbi:nucleoside deaminase [uncultured Pigmentiphaga sp.]|uniref:nucleoside deaminase n=1 Tax=uncultured Pigmentiphaga sp. TaxID=340361 RepID=UPI002620F578|nr:nucleoside deaminase [uncultured Pigmentiphaga sp.]
MTQIELPAEQPLNERDGLYLRRAIELANVAKTRGNRPFGSVIVGADGKVLAEAWNRNGESGDCTAHAETEAIRLASPKYSRDELAGATIYASGEPCVMCAGAIFWANIHRVVFGIDAVRLRGFRGERLDQRDAELSCRDVFAASPTHIECVGPALLDEATAPHEGAWKT